MRHFAIFLAAALAVPVLVPSAMAQKYLPKTIQFKGAPEYTNDELAQAAGLKIGTVLDYADMNAHSQLLVDTGLFSTLAFRFDGQDLIFTLTPAPDVYPVRFANFPFSVGPELEDKIHGTLPLFHGKVPASGGMTDGVCRALESMLAAQNVKATVIATPYTDMTSHKVTAISFSIATPAVEVGEIHLDSNSAAIDSRAKAILARITGSAYDEEGTPGQIAAYLGAFYQDQGYLEVELHATQLAALTDSADAIHIPFSLSISPGTQYRLLGVQLAPGLLVTQADFDHQSHIHPGDVADGTHVRENWEYLSRQYHNHGYLKAQVQPTPTFDRAKATVAYSVGVEPGPVYTMGSLSIEGVSDDLRTAMLAEWKQPAGAIFNEGAIMSLYATQTNIKLQAVFARVNCKYVLHLNEESHTVDVVLRLENK